MAEKECQFCKNHYGADQMFCPECGAFAYTLIEDGTPDKRYICCPQCGKKQLTGGTFCMYCGNRLIMKEEKARKEVRKPKEEKREKKEQYRPFGSKERAEQKEKASALDLDSVSLEQMGLHQGEPKLIHSDDAPMGTLVVDHEGLKYSLEAFNANQLLRYCVRSACFPTQIEEDKGLLILPYSQIAQVRLGKYFVHPRLVIRTQANEVISFLCDKKYKDNVLSACSIIGQHCKIKM